MILNSRLTILDPIAGPITGLDSQFKLYSYFDNSTTWCSGYWGSVVWVMADCTITIGQTGQGRP